jgi:GT2 family glycosyltransferase
VTRGFRFQIAPENWLPDVAAKELNVKLTVIIVTMNRADCVQRCLDCLVAQTRAVDQVVVVDASNDADHRRQTRHAVDGYAGPGAAIYLRNEAGYGHMTMSRNIALEHATGDVIAFLDDDAFARPQWARALMVTYEEDDDVGGVGGRVGKHEWQLDVPAIERPGKIGVLRRDGMIGGAWTVDPGRLAETDHLMGCNMSFRRQVLAELGGMRDEFPGPEMREETDLCLRVRRLGYRLLYNAEAAVWHIGAPKPIGRRFDCWYEYYARHNHVYLLLRNYGFSGMLIFYLLSSSWMDLRLYGGQVVRSRGRELPDATVGWTVVHAGKVMGLLRGSMKRLCHGLDPVRRDAWGERLTRWLSGSASALPGPTGAAPRESGNVAVASQG